MSSPIQYKNQPITQMNLISSSAVHVPAVATQATITVAAPGLLQRLVCTGIVATVAGGAIAQTPIQVYLRNGAAGVGTVMLAASMSVAANGYAQLVIEGLNLQASANTAMTLEFSAAGVAASQEVVTLTYITIASA